MDNISEVKNCYICSRECNMSENRIGACGKYTLKDGKIKEIAENKYLVICGISIETMPILHFHPKGKFLQITTIGCNFNCPGCVSSVMVKELGPDSSALKYKTPSEIIETAKKENCIGISFVMNDPLASYFTFLEVAKKAKEANLLVGCSTNAYFTEKSANEIAEYIDFINVGVKGFNDESYKLCGANEIKPVLENIITFFNKGIHLEISCMYKKGDNENLEKLAVWMSNLNKDIPLQIMRYIPLEDAIVELEPTINEAENLCEKLSTILNYVYLFNTPGTRFLNTYCPECKNIIIERDFYGPMGAKVINSTTNSACSKCGNKISIKGLKEREPFKEDGFNGGYPFTRALEMIQAILITSGVNKLSDVVKVWEIILQDNGIENLHEDIQFLDSYLCSIEKFAGYCGAEEKAKLLASYMREKINEINKKVETVKNKPRVYYCMGKPLFCLNAGRFENQLVTAAGGISVNREKKIDGRPGKSISVDELNELNPDVIFISSFLSNNIDDFYRDCLEMGVKVNAVYSKRIFTHTFPNWDFGSPRWLLGLMNIANILHPDVFKYNMMDEAQEFYNKFYKTEFIPKSLNLSFGKPNNNWNWK
ncbi:radical SAM protein [Anaerovorax odorimutans]|uniref:radical SAM protein n=1 Tax=Anaerovorax odorimutans TaxID=109327 RepID=UPI000489886C|nr:radical SAM protein [Anaerovorax odorimutans]